MANYFLNWSVKFGNSAAEIIRTKMQNFLTFFGDKLHTREELDFISEVAETQALVESVFAFDQYYPMENIDPLPDMDVIADFVV